MKKRVYYKMPGYHVHCYSNKIKDCFDEDRWIPNQKGKIHSILRPYIQKYVKDGRVLRTRGNPDSLRLARNIFKKFWTLVREDMIEEKDTFEFPNGIELSIKQEFEFCPARLNRKYTTCMTLPETIKNRIGCDYVFIFDIQGTNRLKKQLTIGNGNGNSISQNYYLNVERYSQEYYNKRDGHRKLVWGMP